MSETRSAILELGEMLIRTRGYHAFSYHDISRPLAIKNAAVHYHFPTKADLGVTIIENTIAAFGQATASWQHFPVEKQFELFTRIYQDSQSKGWVCLMGALSPAYDTLPQSMQEKLHQMGQEILFWLTTCLERGKAEQVFHFPESAQAKAQVVVAALLSSLLLNKVMGEGIFQSIREAVRKGV